MLHRMGSAARNLLRVASICAASVLSPAWAQPVPLAPPADTAIPAGPLGDAIREGRRIITDTRSAAAAYVGNGLNCSNCHLDAGRTAYAAPFVGLTGMFPEYRSRSGSVESLQRRLNDCFERSMNGKPMPPDSPQMTALVAYIAWLSQGVPVGREVTGRGFVDLKAPATPDPARGKAVYAAKCASCHGAEGQGLPGAAGSFTFPPLWGPQSYNIGAGMARISVAAAFVQAKMPLGAGGSLSTQEAFDVAAYFTAQPRPPFAGTRNDWPKGGRPADAR